MKNKTDELPRLLVIASNEDEDWIKICSDYSDKFKVIQTTWDRISLSSFSDIKFPVVNIGPNHKPLYEEQKRAIYDIKPSLVLVRNLVRYIGSGLGNVPDYRNILYGFYHANIPLINELNAIIAEIEKPIMYGRLRKIRDEVGKENFPLITQYYYSEFSELNITPSCPYVLKVSYPHAGYGKIRVKDYHDTEDLRSILALHKDYLATEPLIDVDYELRIIFIAPNYYRVHKRQSMNWKVNFGMTNIREDCEMKPRWKKWIDLIYHYYPDMLTFDIDALVDTKGNEYILEVNGSTQGFAPEHGMQDLEHMRDLVVRKMEVILGINLLSEENEAKKLFTEKKNTNEIKENEKDTAIVNLKNQIEEYKSQIKKYEKKIKKMESRENENENESQKGKFVNKKNILFLCFIGAIIFFHLSLFFSSKKNV